ncbi:MAG: deaminase [Parcubacteria group bacterium]|nr:deaminase [Parcubacteria group bacterium]
MKRPKTTLFMISSLDGKISSGDTDILDVDSDWNKIRGVKEGLSQYYALEKQTDIVSFITGKTLAKIGINQKKPVAHGINCSMVVIDNKGRLKKTGLQYLQSYFKHVFLVTTKISHPACRLEKKGGNITTISFKKQINFKKLFRMLHAEHGVKRMTIQSGGTMNAHLLREGLIDRVSLVVAPLLVGGKNTPSLIDGESLHSVRDLKNIKPLKLVEVTKLKHSYIHVVYRVLNS